MFLVFNKPYQHFWSLFHSYFIPSKKVLKKVCSFPVRFICLTVDIRYNPNNDTDYWLDDIPSALNEEAAAVLNQKIEDHKSFFQVKGFRGE